MKSETEIRKQLEEWKKTANHYAGLAIKAQNDGDMKMYDEYNYWVNSFDSKVVALEFVLDSD